MNSEAWERSISAEALQRLIIDKEDTYDQVWCNQTSRGIAIASVHNNIQSGKLGNVRHICISGTTFPEGNSMEPNYYEKLGALKKIGLGECIGLEVFPTEEALVDEADVYHVWELQSEKNFPFDLSHIFQLPEDMEKISGKDFGSAYYGMKVQNSKYGRVAYLYMKAEDGKELKWKQKQSIKNQIIGEDLTAVEIVFSKAMNLSYTCLVCLPYGYELDFGLSRTYP